MGHTLHGTYRSIVAVKLIRKGLHTVAASHDPELLNRHGEWCMCGDTSVDKRPAPHVQASCHSTATSSSASNAPMFSKPHGVHARRLHDDALAMSPAVPRHATTSQKRWCPSLVSRLGHIRMYSYLGASGSITSTSCNTAYARPSPRPIAKHKLALPRAFQGVAGPPAQLSRTCKSWLPPFEKSTTLERLEDGLWLLQQDFIGADAAMNARLNCFVIQLPDHSLMVGPRGRASD
ncbi:hypothetical protein HaLaN_20350, partial [Haematococcus lacustris]